MPDHSQLRRKKTKEYLIKTVITSVFLGLFLGFIAWMTFLGPGMAAFQIGWLDLVLLSLATYRMGHLLSYDRVMEPLRSFFTNTIPDPTGEGESVEPKGEGFQQVMGQLLCCPICTGTWAAAVMIYGLYVLPGPTRVFVTIMAVVGLGEILNAAGELFSWGGQYARTKSGATRQARGEQANQMRATSHLGSEPLNAKPPDSLPVEESVFTRRLE